MTCDAGYEDRARKKEDRDLKYKKQGPIVNTKQRCEKRKREASGEIGVSSANVSIDNNEDDVNANKDPDYHFKKPRKDAMKPKVITLELPTKILKDTALTNVRFGGSARSHSMILSETIVAGGGDLADFHISPSTADRARKKVVKTEQILSKLNLSTN